MLTIQPAVVGERTVRMTIDSRLENVSLVGMAIRGILSHTLSGDVAIYQIEVAVVEAVNNAIKHAYGLEGGHEVEISVSIHPETVIFTVCDTGTAMHMSESPDMQYDPGDIPHLPEGGMGIPLMKSIMDDVTYCRQEGKNCLRLCKRL